MDKHKCKSLYLDKVTRDLLQKHTDANNDAFRSESAAARQLIQLGDKYISNQKELKQS